MNENENATDETTKKTTKKAASTPVKKYTKARILESKAYSQAQKDLLNALLEDGVGYSKQGVQKLLDGYLKGTVK